MLLEPRNGMKRDERVSARNSWRAWMQRSTPSRRRLFRSRFGAQIGPIAVECSLASHTSCSSNTSKMRSSSSPSPIPNANLAIGSAGSSCWHATIEVDEQAPSSSASLRPWDALDLGRRRRAFVIRIARHVECKRVTQLGDIVDAKCHRGVVTNRNGEVIPRTDAFGA